MAFYINALNDCNKTQNAQSVLNTSMQVGLFNWLYAMIKQWPHYDPLAINGHVYVADNIQYVLIHC